MTEKRKRQLQSRYVKAYTLVATAMRDVDCGVAMLLYIYPGLEKAFQEMEVIRAEVKRAMVEEQWK